MRKYYYQRGMCAALCYMSLNPVLYETTGKEQEYKKVAMACNCVEEGICSKETSCSLFSEAPKSIADDGICLRTKKF